MVYIAELSFTTKKTKNVDGTLKYLDELCDYYNCIEKYNITETKSKKYNYETLYIYTCKFQDNDDNTVDNTNIIRFSDFIKDIKKNKDFNIDIITTDDIRCNIIYMSPYYLRTMCKEERNDYIINQKKRRYSETDYFILKQFTSELSKYNKEFVKENSNKFSMSYDEYLKMLNC
jgi:hypothetical protein